MIKLFRSIRRKLLAEGSLSNYFFYALGEILLVVVGILIALYINNENEQRKNKVANANLLEQLRQENQLNLADLQDDLAYRDTISTMLYKFHQFLKQKEIENNVGQLQQYLIGMSRATTYNASSDYLRKYIASNTGNNSELVAELIQLNAYQFALKLVSEKALELKFEKYFDYLATDVDFETLEIASFNKLNSLEFKNNIILLESLEQGVFDQFEDTYAQQQLIDSLIRLELQ